MTLYLHVGTGKTGTTTIQTFLEANRDALVGKGLIVPRSLGRQNHRNLAAYALDDDVIDNSRRAKRLTSLERISAFRQTVEADLAEEAASWPASANIVMTSEQMTRLRRPGEVERLRDLLSFLGQEIKVVAYIRRQDEYFVSEYSQLIKGGQTLDFSIENKLNLAVYNYEKFLGGWASVFGDENIIVRTFDRDEFASGDLLTDFLSIVGVADIEGCVVTASRNPSLDAQTVEFLRLLNPSLPRWEKNGVNAERGLLISQLEDISDGPKLRLSSEDAQTLMARFADSNAVVAKRYLGRADGVLFKAPPTDQTAISPGLTGEQAATIGLRLWKSARDTEPK